jgi:hypothetical protein
MHAHTAGDDDGRQNVRQMLDLAPHNRRATFAPELHLGIEVCGKLEATLEEHPAAGIHDRFHDWFPSAWLARIKSHRELTMGRSGEECLGCVQVQ